MQLDREMAAGESIVLEVEFDFSHNGCLGKDWSVVAWGEKGPVKIKHNKDYLSDTLPFIADRPVPEEAPIVPEEPTTPQSL